MFKNHKYINKFCLKCDKQLTTRNNTGYCKKHMYLSDLIKSYYRTEDQRAKARINKLRLYHKNRKDLPKLFCKYCKNKLNQNNKSMLCRKHKGLGIRIKLGTLLRRRLLCALKRKKWNKDCKFTKIIGCSLDKLKHHLEKQFKPRMTWENHSLKGWHIDHIIPLNTAKTKKQLYKLSHYSNLQPLWAKENLSKGKT